MNTPNGLVLSSWSREESAGKERQLVMWVVVPPNTIAMVLLPLLGLSNVTVTETSQREHHRAYTYGLGLVASRETGLLDGELTVSGSYVAVAFRAMAGRYKFILHGVRGVPVCGSSPVGGPGVHLQCAHGMIVVTVEVAVFGVVDVPACGVAPRV